MWLLWQPISLSKNLNSEAKSKQDSAVLPPVQEPPKSGVYFYLISGITSASWSCLRGELSYNTGKHQLWGLEKGNKLFSPVHYNHCSLLFWEDVVRILWADVYFLTWEDPHSGSWDSQLTCQTWKGQQGHAEPKVVSRGSLRQGPCKLPFSSSLSLFSIPSLSTCMSLLYPFVLPSNPC